VEGLIGPQGIQGPPGPQGVPGTPGQIVFVPGMFDVSTDLGYFEDLLDGIEADTLPYVSDVSTVEGELVWGTANPHGSGTYYGVAMDDDGSNLAIVIPNVAVYISSDYGENWTYHDFTSTNIQRVCLDGDGSNIAVCGPYELWITTNGGTNWTERTPGSLLDNRYWEDIDISSDGNNIVVCSFGSTDGRLFTSTNAGVDWTERDVTGTGSHSWSRVISDDAGQVILASSVTSNDLWISTDYGVNWAEVQPTGGSVSSSWLCTAVSGDGTTLLAGLYNNKLYKSVDSGSNWSEVTIPTAGETWQCAAIDYDGSHMLVGLYSSEGRVFESTDAGSTWAETQPAGDVAKSWWNVETNTDGSRHILSALGGVVEGVYLSVMEGSYDVTTWDTSEITPAARAFLDDATTGEQVTTLGFTETAGDISDHIFSDGSDHTFIDQDVTIAATPTHTSLIIPQTGYVGSSASQRITFDSSIVDTGIKFNSQYVTFRHDADSYNSTEWFNCSSSAEGVQNAWVGNRGRGTLASPNTVQDGDELCSIRARGHDGAATEYSYKNAAYIQFFVDGTPATGKVPGKITFSTTKEGEAVPTLALTIDSNQDAAFVGDVTGANLNISNWDTAYGWGDHAGLYDAVGTASGLISTHESTYNHANYNTAYTHSQLTSGNPHSVTPAELSLVIGTNVQAWDAQLDDIAALAVTDGNIIVGDGANWVAESGDTARISLGLGTTDSPTFVDLTLSSPSNIYNLSHDSFADFEANEHIDWTNAGSNLITSGTIYSGSAFGIGDFDSGAQLTVARPAGYSYINFNTYSATSAQATFFRLQKSHNNSIGTLSATQNGEVLGAFEIKGVNTSGGFDQGFRMICTQVGAASASTVPCKLDILTQGSSGGLNSRILIDETGDVDVPLDFTAGTIQADNGYTGSWVNNEGNTVTVVGGIITDVS
jgi:hypothetical protein